MGVMRDKGPTKPRPAMAVQHPSPRAASGTAPSVMVKTTVAASAPPARRKEEEKLRGTSAQSRVNSIANNITNNNTGRTNIVLAPSDTKDDQKNENRTKIVLAATEAKDHEKNEEKNYQNEKESSLVLALGEMSLNEDNDLNKQIKNLSIKDSHKEKEQGQDSDLLSRGPDRVCSKGNSRTAPYLYEQHIVSFDKHGGGTVLCPNISPPHKDISYQQDLQQEFYTEISQNSSQDSGIFTSRNCLNGSYNELENAVPELPEELPHLSEEDLHILRMLAEKACDSNLSDLFSYDIDKIIESNTDEKDIQPIKRELCEATPKTPDSAYDSDCSIGSPSSVTSVVMRTDRENLVTVSAPYTPVVPQLTNVHTQSGFASDSVSPVIQTVPLTPGVFVWVPKKVMPPPQRRPILPQLQQQPQPLTSPSTPPLSPQVLRPILPGINLPDACNKCNEPAIYRIRSKMSEQTKDRAWAIMFAYHETKFTDEDEDGNMFLSCVLSNWQKIKNFLEVLHSLIQRLKEIINKNQQMAYKLLATPNKTGHTPLDIACRFLRSSPENALAVRYLADTMVEEGIAIGKEVDGNGNTLLHKLCACGDEACYIMAELLCMKDQHGKRVFDINQKNNEGKTPLHIVGQTHSDRTSCAVLAQLLMRSGADVSVKEGCAGNTVFHLVARESCDPKLLVTLLEHTSCASKVVNEKNFNEDTPLHMVAANHAVPPTRQRLAVQHLIDRGADPKLQNKSRKAPLSLVPAERKQDIKNVLYQKNK